MNTKLSKKTKYNKLLKAHQNNLEISNMELGNKFTNFEISKLDESNTLLFEINNNNKYYKRYKRGSIVRVKFGVNIGSEFSGEHFAIVVSKGDTMMNPTLHVIPITSKKHTKTLNIGSILYNDNEINSLINLLENNKEKLNNQEIKDIQAVIRYYQNRKDTVSYACIDHLKTVSKLSVSKRIFLNNKYDYLPNLICNENLMKTIDNCIIKEFTINEN